MPILLACMSCHACKQMFSASELTSLSNTKRCHVQCHGRRHKRKAMATSSHPDATGLQLCRHVHASDESMPIMMGTSAY